MTNKKKAEEILDCENCKKQLFIGCVKCPPTCADYNDLMKMAQWKDEQFNKFLLWLDDNYVIRRLKDGESMTYAELVNEFKNMDYERDNQAKD
jgi:hypothetical protein